MTNKWVKHVMEYWKSHPNKSYREVMRDARSSYYEKNPDRLCLARLKSKRKRSSLTTTRRR